MSNVLPLFPSPSTIGHFVRIGHTAHRYLEDLHQAGRLPIRRAVADAAHMDSQSDLMQTLGESGTELVLDTKSAELSMPASLGTKSAKLPWANPDPTRFHEPKDWAGTRGRDLCERIAEFAVSHGVDAVLSPSHLVADPNDAWFVSDLKACSELRAALDRLGGRSIRLDYELIVPMRVLRDAQAVETIEHHLGEIDFSNLWIKASGFGMGATATAIARYVRAAHMLSSSGRPIVADGVAGLAGIAISAFGAVGGIAHGIAEKGRFDAASWKRPRNANQTFGPKKRIYLPQIDQYLYEEQARTLLEGRGAKTLFLCTDPSCCPNKDDMFSQHRGHALIQSSRLVDRINSQPEPKRIDYFMDHMLAPVGRSLLKAEKLKLADPKINEKLNDLSKRAQLQFQGLESFRDSLAGIPNPSKPQITKATIKRGSQSRHDKRDR